MIVVFEGPDGAGKSRMIDHVATEAEADGVPVGIWHRGPFPPGGNPWTEYVLPLTTLCATTDWIVLVDRWHLGELVYGPIFRGRSQLSLAQRDWIDGYLKSMGAVMIHLTATPDELCYRLAKRGDDMVRADHVPAILAGYSALIGDGHQPRMMTRTYDTTGQRTQPTAAAIYQLARMDTAIALAHQRHPSTDHRPYWEINPWPG